MNLRNTLILILAISMLFACTPTTETPPAPEEANTTTSTPTKEKTPEPLPMMEYQDLVWTTYTVDVGQIAKFNINDLGFNSCIAVVSAPGESTESVAFSQEILPEIRPLNGKFTTIKIACPTRTLGDVTRIGKKYIREQLDSTLATALFIRENTVDCSWWACNHLPENWSYNVRGAEGLDNIYSSTTIYTENYLQYWTAGYPASILFTCNDGDQVAMILSPGTRPSEDNGPCFSGVYSATGVKYVPQGPYDTVGLQLALIQKAEKLISEYATNNKLYRKSTYPDLIGWGYYNLIPVNMPADMPAGIIPTPIPDSLP